MKNINSRLAIVAGILISITSCQPKQEKPMGDTKVLANVKVTNSNDPVCGMSTSVHMKDTLTYQGKLYGFCGSQCKEEFKKDPQKYLKKQ